MSSASSRAESGNIIYGNADGSGTSNTLVIAAAILGGLVLLVMLLKK